VILLLLAFATNFVMTTVQAAELLGHLT